MKCWIIGLAMSLAASTGPDAAAAPRVRTAQGVVEGYASGATERFIGVPYAAAPARWQAPGPAPRWRGVRKALAQVPRCPQSVAGLADGREREDCLYLNVFRPAGRAPPRAVYLYVHGGGATGGSGMDHDGAALAERGDIVVVTINYRLGALGFLNSELLGRRAGNYALQDVGAALRWVRGSIRAFGGDPDRITLGGESAGGTIICPLLRDPAIDGMVRAAIVSSDDCLRDTDSTSAARARAAAYLGKLGCASAQCLRELPVAALVGGFVAAPTVDERPPIRVPLLLGANLHEGRVAGPEFEFFDEARYAAWLARLVDPVHVPRVMQAYREEGRGAGPRYEYAYRISAIITDSGMRGFGGCSLLRLARLSAAPVYLYQFEDPDAPFGKPGMFAFGAAHAAELLYLWPAGPNAGAFERLSVPQRRLSQRMLADWGSFVRGARANWPALRDAAVYMAYAPGTSGPQPLTRYQQQHRCALWDSIPPVMGRGHAM